MKNIILKSIRVLLGWTLLWAFLDKTFGLGFATKPESSWLNGGSPTMGFLTHATKGPFAEFYQSLAGQGWVDWMFMLGILALGISLIIGIWVQYSGWFATILFLMMYSAGFLPPENNPLVDEHVIYAFLSAYFAVDAQKKNSKFN